MKILQVTNFFKPSFESGGPARMSYEISKKLLERGHEVTVYTTDGFKSRLEIEKNKPVDVDGIKTYYFRNLFSYLTRKMKLPIPWRLPAVARREIKDFDVIHIHEHRTVLAIIVHHYAKKYGVPYVLQPRGSVPRMRWKWRKKLFDLLFGHDIIKDADKLIASSKIESEQYWDVFHDLKSEKIVHVPNGIDLETYQDLPKKGCFRKKYSIDENEKMILFFSRIVEHKGADILIQAFNNLKKQFEETKLVIAGPDEGGYLDKLKSIVSNLNIADDVIFPGPLYEKDKLEIYVDADIFVLPSKKRYESFGNVVLEAAVCGTPSVVTDVCGVSEWLDNIILVEPNVNSIERGIKRGLKQKNLGKNARVEIKQKVSWGKILPKIEDIYEEMMDGSRSKIQ